MGNTPTPGAKYSISNSSLKSELLNLLREIPELVKSNVEPVSTEPSLTTFPWNLASSSN